LLDSLLQEVKMKMLPLLLAYFFIEFSVDASQLNCTTELENYKEFIAPILGLMSDIDVQNAEGDTLLMVAARNGLTDLVNDLLNLNASIGIMNNANSTASQQAKGAGFEEIVEIIKNVTLEEISQNDNVDCKANVAFNGEKLCEAAKDGDVEEVIQQIVCGGGADMLKANPKCRVSKNPFRLENSTALLEASINEHPKVVEAILKHVPIKEYINFQERKYGMTALMMAIYQGNEEIATMLLKAQADPDIREWEGKSAIYFAKDDKGKPDEDMRKILLEHGASPQERGPRQTTCRYIECKDQ